MKMIRYVVKCQKRLNLWKNYRVVSNLYRFSTMFLATCIFASVILDLPASIEARSALMGFAEDTAYSALEAAIVSAGNSEYYASCFVRMLKMQGATSTVLTLDFNKMQNEFHSADLICSIHPIILFPSLIALFLITLCCCCKCCLWRRSTQSNRHYSKQCHELHERTERWR